MTFCSTGIEVVGPIPRRSSFIANVPNTWISAFGSSINFLIALAVFIIQQDWIIIWGSLIIALVALVTLAIFLTNGNGIASLLGFAPLMLQLSLGASLPTALYQASKYGASVHSLLLSVSTTEESYSEALFFSIMMSLLICLLACHRYIILLESKITYSLRACLKCAPSLLITATLLIVSLELLLLATGSIGIRGFSSDVTGNGPSLKIPWYSPLLIIAEGLQMPLAAICLTRYFNNSYKEKRIIILLMFIILICFGLYVQMLKNRHSFVTHLILFFIYLQFFNRSTRVIARILPILLIFLLFIGPILDIINALRFEGNKEGSVIQKVTIIASDYITSSSYREELQSRSSENLSTRPLVLGIIASTMSLPANQMIHSNGALILSGLVWALPRALFSKKESFMRDEELIYQHVHDPIFLSDQADSFALYGWVDFGWVGAIIYPTIIVFLWLIVLYIMQIPLNPIFTLTFFSIWPPYWFTAMGESDSTALFETIRTSITFCICIFILSTILKKRFLKRHYKNI